MSSNYYSQTPNFVSASSEDVDPRTRLFSFQHSLGQLIGNNGMGPELAFTISYSANSATDYFDLGVGIAPALTIYDDTTGQLSLASGESFRIDTTVNPPLVQQNKMRIFDFVRMSNPDGSYGFRVIEHDGSVTDLTEYDAGIYVPTRMYTALGYSLIIDWEFTSWGWGIDNISDDSGVTLLKFDHDAGPTLIFYPGSTEEYSIILSKSNGYLSSISHSGLSEGKWEYYYDDVGMGDGLLTLVQTKAITGLTKSVTYNSGSTSGLMQFPPQSGQRPLPAVTQLVIDPGFNQPAMVTTYTPDTPQGFPSYLGYDAPQGGQWDSSTDYVLTLAGQDYSYTTTLTQTDSDGQEITTTYTYNNYHLLSKVEVVQGSTYYSTETWYYADAWQEDNPNTSYDELPAQYQYPQHQTLTWRDSSGSRNELTQYQYDDFGNLTQQIDPDGTQTDYEFYSADGEADSADGYTGCPADVNGFSNLVKSKKVTPAPSDYDDVPIRATYTRYDSLATLNDLPMTTSIVKVKESLVKLTDSGKQPLTTLDTQYYSDDKTSFIYGQLSAKNTTVYSTDSKGISTAYLMIQGHDYTLAGSDITSTMTLTSFDGLSLTSSVTHSYYSGKLSAMTDFLGTSHNYYYDAAGRFQKMVTHEGDAKYERGTSTTYNMATNSTGNITELSTSFTDYSGSVTRFNHDSLGRVISIDKTATEQIDEEFSRVLARSYDSIGRVLYETITDSYLDKDTHVQSAVINIKTQFDDWGRRQAHDFFSDSAHPEDSVYLTRALQFDSVGNAYSKYLQSTSNISDKRQIKLNNMAVPELITTFNADGSEYSRISSAYDGLKRLRELEDQLGNPTVYEYDDFDRVYKTTYADGTVVTQTYAPQFSLAIATSVIVTDKDGTAYNVGTREIDGLGRVKNSTVGGRHEMYTYTDNTADPTTFTDSLNRTFIYTYDRKLENALIGISTHPDGQPVDQSYSYFNKVGLLDTATEGDQKSNSYTWFASGQIDKEKVENGLGTKTPTYTWSIMNKPVSYTDIAGHAQWTSYFLSGKNAAKPFSFSDSAATVDYDYDEFGRLYTQTAKSTSGSATLETKIIYDDFGREHQRKLTLNSGSVICITTEYYENNQVAGVNIKQDSTLLSDNSYYYDLRNRLHRHDCSGSMLPKDGYGQTFTSQVFEYDCLNNIKECTTVSSSGVTDVATFSYENSKDPTQLTTIKHQGNPAYPAVITLSYYDDGCLKYDEAGRLLTYDASGRLFNIEATDGTQASYSYDGLHNLIYQSINGDEQYLYYRGSLLVNQVRESEQQQDRLISGLTGNAAVSHESL